MNDILLQVSTNHSERISDYQEIIKSRISSTHQTIQQLIEDYTSKQIKRNEVETGLLEKLKHWTHTEGFQKIIFKKWTQKMLESINLPYAIIFNVMLEQNLLDLFIYLFNSRGQYILSYQIQSLKLKQTLSKIPIYQILAYKLLYFIKQQILKRIKSLHIINQQQCKKKLPKMQLIGEKLRNSQFAFNNISVRLNQKDYRSHYQTSGNREQSKILNTANSTKLQKYLNSQEICKNQQRKHNNFLSEELKRISTQQYFFKGKRNQQIIKCSGQIKTKNEQKNENKRKTMDTKAILFDLYKHLEIEIDELPYFGEKSLLFNSMLNKNLMIKFEITKYYKQYNNSNKMTINKNKLRIKLFKDKLDHPKQKNMSPISFLRNFIKKKQKPFKMTLDF